MAEKKQASSKLVSLNEELMTEFRITELEKRLETDPLIVASPIDGASEDVDCFMCSRDFYCHTFIPE